MPGASGPSKQEALERLIAELRCLSPNGSGPEFHSWRASVNTTLSELFGPRHRLTLALRDVNFTPDFERGRARALALLRAASSLTTAQPIPHTAAEPPPVAIEDSPATHPAISEEPMETISWPAAAARPDATVELPETGATAGTSAALNDDVSAQPMPDTVVRPAPDAIKPRPETISRRVARKRDSPGTHPVIPEEPTDTVPREAPVRPVVGPDTVLSEPATAQPVAASAAKSSRDAKTGAIIKPAVPDWPDWPDWTFGPDATAGASPTVDDGASAQPSEPTDHDASVQPMSNESAVSTPDATEPKRGTIFRRVARKRDSSGTLPPISEETDLAGEESHEGSPVEAPDPVPIQPATPELAPPSVADLPGTAEPAAIADLPGTAEPDATAGASPTVDDDAEPKRGTIFRRVARKRDASGTLPPMSEEPTDLAGGESHEGSPVEAPDPVPIQPATVQPAAASAAEPTKPAALPTPDTAAWPARGAATSLHETISPPGTAEPATIAEPPPPKRETIARESDTSWTPRSTVRESETSRTARPTARESDASWELRSPARESDTSWTPRSTARESDTSRTAQTIAGEFDTPWTAPTMGREFDAFGTAPAMPQRATWGDSRASRRPKRGRKGLTVAAVIIVLALAVGLPVWLAWFGGWSTISGLWSSTATSTTMSLPNASTISPSANAWVVDVTGDPRSAYIAEVVRVGIVQLIPNEAGGVSFLPAKLVGRGEFLVWLDRVRQIPAGSREVPDTFYHDLGLPLRNIAIDAYQLRIVIEWPDEDPKIAFDAAAPILPRDAEAWAARMIIGLLPVTALQSALAITEANALDLRARISSLDSQDLARVVEGFKLLPQAGWAKEKSISRSEAAEFLMKLKAVFDKYLPV